MLLRPATKGSSSDEVPRKLLSISIGRSRVVSATPETVTIYKEAIDKSVSIYRVTISTHGRTNVTYAPTRTQPIEDAAPPETNPENENTGETRLYVIYRTEGHKKDPGRWLYRVRWYG